MSFSSPNTRYEPPIRTETFYQPAQPNKQSLFLFRSSDSDFVSGTTRSLPHDWSAYGTAGFSLLMAVVFAFLILPPILLSINLNQRGQTTQAMVSYEHTSSGKSTSYYVTFSYTVAGLHYDVQQSVQSTTYYSLRIGSTVPIRYLPDSPDQAQLAGAYINDADNPVSLIFAAITVIFMVGVIIMTVRYVLRTRNLILYGQIVDGTVESASMSRSKSRYTLKLKYSFPSPISGQPLQRSESRDRTDLGAYGAPGNGTPVKVLYLNDRMYRVM